MHMDEDQKVLSHEKENNEEVEVDESAELDSDKLTPDHPRFKEVNQRMKDAEERAARLETQIAELKSMREEYEALRDSKQNSQGDEFTSDEEKALDRIILGLKKREVLVTKEELQEQERIKQRAETQKTLQNEYNGKNGYPKFDVVDVTEYAKKNGFGDNLRAAYKDMHYSAILKIEASRMRDGGSETIDSEQALPQERRVAGELTPEDIGKMSASEWKKNEAKIMADFKKLALK